MESGVQENELAAGQPIGGTALSSPGTDCHDSRAVLHFQ